MKLPIGCLTILLNLLLVSGPSVYGAASESMDFKEVYELLRTNLTGVDEAELSHAAAAGLISELRPKVVLVSKDAMSSGQTNAPAPMRTAIFDGGLAYIRLNAIQPGTEHQLKSTYQSLASSNRIKGLVLDLRFADGTDYNAAAAVADWFFSSEQPLIDFGQGVKKSTAKSDAFTKPLALLINNKTTAAAEALVGILRQAEIGVAIGSHTAGLASIGKEFTLKTGQILRVATMPIKVGKGQALPHTGVKPDITVEVPLQDEALYMQDAYKELARTSAFGRTAADSTNELANGTNRIRHRINEAELVRMLQNGETLEEAGNARGSETNRRLVQDPVLVRALDLLKALSVLRQARPL